MSLDQREAQIFSVPFNLIPNLLLKLWQTGLKINNFSLNSRIFFVITEGKFFTEFHNKSPILGYQTIVHYVMRMPDLN